MKRIEAPEPDMKLSPAQFDLLMHLAAGLLPQAEYDLEKALQLAYSRLAETLLDAAAEGIVVAQTSSYITRLRLREDGTWWTESEIRPDHELPEV